MLGRGRKKPRPITMTKKLIILTVLSIIFVPGMTQGQENELLGNERTIVVSPLTFDITANPGEIVSNSLTIRNAGNAPVFITMEVEDFTTIGETGKVLVEELEDESYSLKRWITLNPKNFTLAPGERKYINFTIHVPTDGEPGGHYGTILAGASGAVAGTGLSVAQKAGALILLSVAGEVREEMNIREFSAPSFSEYGPIPFTMRFENLGTVHIKPQGFVSITDIFDKKIIDIPFPQHNILPGRIRSIETTWDKKWLFGKYTASLVGNYGNANIPFTQLATFWVFPWKILTPAIFGLFAILYIIYRIRRRIKLAWRILWRGEIGN